MPLLSIYERKARLVPGILVLAPVAVTIVALGLKSSPVIAVLIALMSFAGGTYLLAARVGDSGRRAQRALWEKWDGAPTTHLLRMRESASNPLERDRWRRDLMRFTKIKLLSSGRELSDPSAADQAIIAAVDQVRYLGHGNKFQLLASENARYGLERNLWGIRWAGRVVSFLSCLTLGVASFFGSRAIDSTVIVVGIAVNALLLLLWSLLPSCERVRTAGYRYAEQLLNAVSREVEGRTPS